MTAPPGAPALQLPASDGVSAVHRRGKYLGPVQLLDVPEWSTFWQSLEPLIDDIRKATILPQEYHRPLIMSPALKLAKAAFILSASPQHHDQEAGGLVRHTLRVAADVVRRAPGIARQNGCDLTKQDHAALIAMAFLHDMGRIFEMRVTADGNPSQRWEPYDLNLHEWCSSNKVQRLHVTWRTDRALSGPKSSEQLGIMLFAHFIPTSLITFLGQGMSVAMAHAFSRSVGKPAFDYYRLLKASDVACARQARGKEPIADYIMRELEEAIIAVGPNRMESGVFVSPTHTAIAIPGTTPDPLRTTAWNRLLVNTVGVHPEVATGSDLFARMVELRPNAFVWWTPNGEKQSPSAQHIAILEDGCRFPVILIDNRMLWSGGSAPLGFGTPPRLWLGRPGSPMQASADPSTLGFIAQPPGPGARLPAASTAPPVPVETALPPAPVDVPLDEHHSGRQANGHGGAARFQRKEAQAVSADALAQGKIPAHGAHQGVRSNAVRSLPDMCALRDGDLNINERIVALLQVFVSAVRHDPSPEESKILQEIGDPFSTNCDAWRSRTGEIIILLLRRFNPPASSF